MTDYDIYVFILCLVVFLMLTALSAVCLTCIVKLTVKLIRYGGQDIEILKEEEKLNKKGHGGCILCNILSLLICLVFIFISVFSIYMNFQTESTSDTVPTLRVVKSESMSYKLESNTYLYENNLNDQFDMFDIVFTYKMPDEFELELYDIVVYEIDDTMVIHRIIAIEEPNNNHPDSRRFTLRGDNNSYSDSTTVKYEQMLGIYRGEKIRFLGSFVMFMQSPAGWLCLLLLVAAVILTPIIENYVGKRKSERLTLIRSGTVDADFDIDGFYKLHDEVTEAEIRETNNILAGSRNNGGTAPPDNTDEITETGGTAETDEVVKTEEADKTDG